jgi:hypothetical protein
MKQLRRELFTVEIDIYETTVLVGLNASHKDITKFLAKHNENWGDGNNFNAQAKGMASFSPHSRFIVLQIEGPLFTPDWYGTLAHEAEHTSHFIMKNVGVPSDGIDEPYAYVTGYIVQKVLEKLKHGRRVR